MGPTTCGAAFRHGSEKPMTGGASRTRRRSRGTQPSAFVTYGWCRTAYTVVRSLGSKGIEVHVGDASGSAMARFSRFARSFTRLPDFFAEPDAYLDAVAVALRRTGARVLFPCHEDVELVIRGRGRLPADLMLAVPTLERWGTAEDKLLCARHAERAGCPTPPTYEVRSLDELRTLGRELAYPLVIKTRIGNSAKGVRIARSYDDLLTRFEQLVRSFDLTEDRLPVLQAFVDGPKLGVLGVYDRGKHVSSIVFDIVRSKGAANFGTSTYRVTVDDPVTQRNAIAMMESLDWHGVVDMDWLRGSDGVASLIDVNGRLGGATALTMVAGMDLPYAWYRVATGTAHGAEAPTRVGAKARWILGDTLGLLDSARQGRLRECVAGLRPQWRCGYDDLVWHDPVPFVAQGIDYLRKFAAAGGSSNPITKGMIR